VKQHARAKIRDAERLLKSTEMEEQKHQKNLIHAQSEVRACGCLVRSESLDGGMIGMIVSKYW